MTMEGSLVKDMATLLKSLYVLIRAGNISTLAGIGTKKSIRLPGE